jgi:hypothetical protein
VSSKWREVLQFFVDSGERVDLFLPGIGFATGTIEALTDDVATLALEMGSSVSKAHLHFTQVGILRR